MKISSFFSISCFVLYTLLIGVNAAGTQLHQKDDVLQLTQYFMSIDSTSYDEYAIGEALVEWFESHGWTAVRQEVEEGRNNVFAYWGNASNPTLIINSHMDCVPPFLPPTEDDKNIYGRGSTDAKSNFAALMTAVQEMVNANEIDPARIGFLIVVGEEVDHIGMKKANELGLTPEYVLVGEPTESLLAVGHKGMIKFSLTTYGKAAHSGYPELGDSAIIPLMELLLELNNYDWPVDDRLGPTTLNVGTITGGTAANIVPDYAHSEITVRVSTNASEILDIIEGIVGDRAEMNIVSINEPVICATVPGYETTIVAYNTDIPYLLGDHLNYLIGPGSILVAHTDDEYILKLELKNHVELYKQLITDILAQQK